MKKKFSKTILLALIVLLGLAKFGLSAGRDSMQVLLPKDKSYLTGSYVNFVAAVDPLRIDSVSLSVNKKTPVILQVSKGTHKILPDSVPYLCNTLNLDEGENILTVNASWQGKEIETRRMNLFLLSKSSPNKNTAPPGYQLYLFHTERAEALCDGCHKELTQSDKQTTALQDSPCYKCHPHVVAEKFKHGPAAVGDCISCHNISEKGKFLIAQPLKKLCYACHEEVMKPWETKKFVHGPTATGDCTICHNPHSSSEKFFLRKKTNDLCIGCHEEKATGKHVIASFVFGSSHPVSGKSNPLKPDRGFSCASCHSPHAGNTKEIYALDAQGGRFAICQACHKK